MDTQFLANKLRDREVNPTKYGYTQCLCGRSYIKATLKENETIVCSSCSEEVYQDWLKKQK